MVATSRTTHLLIAALAGCFVASTAALDFRTLATQSENFYNEVNYRVQLNQAKTVAEVDQIEKDLMNRVLLRKPEEVAYRSQNDDIEFFNRLTAEIGTKREQLIQKGAKSQMRSLGFGTAVDGDDEAYRSRFSNNSRVGGGRHENSTTFGGHKNVSAVSIQTARPFHYRGARIGGVGGNNTVVRTLSVSPIEAKEDEYFRSLLPTNFLSNLLTGRAKELIDKVGQVDEAFLNTLLTLMNMGDMQLLLNPTGAGKDKAAAKKNGTDKAKFRAFLVRQINLGQQQQEEARGDFRDAEPANVAPVEPPATDAAAKTDQDAHFGYEIAAGALDTFGIKLRASCIKVLVSHGIKAFNGGLSAILSSIQGLDLIQMATIGAELISACGEELAAITSKAPAAAPVARPAVGMEPKNVIPSVTFTPSPTEMTSVSPATATTEVVPTTPEPLTISTTPAVTTKGVDNTTAAAELVLSPSTTPAAVQSANLISAEGALPVEPAAPLISSSVPIGATCLEVLTKHGVKAFGGGITSIMSTINGLSYLEMASIGAELMSACGDELKALQGNPNAPVRPIMQVKPEAPAVKEIQNPVVAAALNTSAVVNETTAEQTAPIKPAVETETRPLVKPTTPLVESSVPLRANCIEVLTKHGVRVFSGDMSSILSKLSGFGYAQLASIGMELMSACGEELKALGGAPNAPVSPIMQVKPEAPAVQEIQNPVVVAAALNTSAVLNETTHEQTAPIKPAVETETRPLVKPTTPLVESSVPLRASCMEVLTKHGVKVFSGDMSSILSKLSGFGYAQLASIGMELMNACSEELHALASSLPNPATINQVVQTDPQTLPAADQPLKSAPTIPAIASGTEKSETTPNAGSVQTPSNNDSIAAVQSPNITTTTTVPTTISTTPAAPRASPPATLEVVVKTDQHNSNGTAGAEDEYNWGDGKSGAALRKNMSMDDSTIFRYRHGNRKFGKKQHSKQGLAQKKYITDILPKLVANGKMNYQQLIRTLNELASKQSTVGLVKALQDALDIKIQRQPNGNVLVAQDDSDIGHNMFSKNNNKKKDDSSSSSDDSSSDQSEVWMPNYILPPPQEPMIVVMEPAASANLASTMRPPANEPQDQEPLETADFNFGTDGGNAEAARKKNGLNKNNGLLVRPATPAARPTNAKASAAATANRRPARA